MPRGDIVGFLGNDRGFRYDESAEVVSSQSEFEMIDGRARIIRTAVSTPSGPYELVKQLGRVSPAIDPILC